LKITKGLTGTGVEGGGVGRGRVKRGAITKWWNLEKKGP